MKNFEFIVAFGVSALLAACGGGGTPGTNTAEVDQISNVTLNPAAAVQSLYVATVNAPSIQYSAGTPEIFNGVTYQVQNVLTIDSNGNSNTFKRYYTLSPFSIFTPPYSYSPSDSHFTTDSITIYRGVGTLPTSAKIGDFGLYETVTVSPYIGSYQYATYQITSPWTLTKYSNTTALFCFGTLDNPALTVKTCYKLNAHGEVV